MSTEKDFYQKRKEHRREMRKILPSDLQLEFPSERPETEKWSFEGKLLKLRSSQEPEDRLFIETLRLKIKEELGKEITAEERKEIEKLKELSKEKRKNMLFI